MEGNKMRKTIVATVMALFIMAGNAIAGHLQPEKHYQEKWCRENSGQVEYTLPDKTRCDCLTETHAVEFDFGTKWAEAIGQSLYYSLQTGKRAGIGLIIEAPTDRKYWIRLNTTIDHFKLPIDTWEVSP
jgi:hypothetical protein